MKTDLGYGDRLISVTTGLDETTYRAGKHGVLEITIGRVPGPHDWVLTAQVTFEDRRPDLIIPLYMAARFEVQYGD